MSLKFFFIIGCLLSSVLMFSQKNIFEIARSGSVEDIKKLMLINPDTINKIDSNGYVPLTLATYSGNIDVSLFLIDKVGNIDGNSKYGTPLTAAVFKDRVEIVRALLKAGANPNIADTNGTTPLHYAVMINSVEVIKLLKEANANTSAKDYRGKTALDYAVMTNKEEIIVLLNKK